MRSQCLNSKNIGLKVTMSALTSWSHLFHCSLGGDHRGVLGPSWLSLCLRCPRGSSWTSSRGREPLAPRFPGAPSVAASSALGGRGPLEPPAGPRGQTAKAYLTPSCLPGSPGHRQRRWCPWGRAGGWRGRHIGGFGTAWWGSEGRTRRYSPQAGSASAASHQRRQRLEKHRHSYSEQDSGESHTPISPGGQGLVWSVLLCFKLSFIWIAPVFSLTPCFSSRISFRRSHWLYVLHELGILGSVTVSQSFLVFHDLDSLEEYWSRSLSNVPQFGLFDIFLKIRLGLWFFGGLADGSDSKESTCNAGDCGSIPGVGRSPTEKNGNPLQYSCLENPMDRGGWWATLQGVVKSSTQVSN